MRLRPPASAVLAAALSLAARAPAGAAPMCLKPGSLGPDVPSCRAYQDGAEAKTSVADNLLAIAGQAATENFEERQAIDAAGPIQLGRTAAPSRTAPSRAQALAAFGVSEGADGLARADAQAAAAAEDIVKGTGNVFQSLGRPARNAGAVAAAGASLTLTGALNPSSTVTPAARAQAGSSLSPAGGLAAAGASGPAAARPFKSQTSIGQLSTISDPGRQVFDQSAAGLPDDVSPGAAVAAPRAPTVRECSPLHPCANED